MISRNALAKPIQQRMCLLLLFVAAILYLPGLNGQFVNDDRTYFIDNDLLPRLFPWDFSDIFLHASNYWGELLPLRDFCYVVQYRLFGTDPLGYHLASLALYLVVVTIAWKLVKATATEEDDLPGSMPLVVFATALFVVHPVHVETVAYISGQKDLLCALFSLLAILLALRLLHTPGAATFPRDTALFVLCYYAGFLSKNLNVATGLLITIYALFEMPRLSGRRRLKLAAFWTLINLPVLYWLYYNTAVSKGIWGDMDVMVAMPFTDKLLRGVRISGEHFILLGWPSRLNFGYPFNANAGLDAPFWIGSFVLLLLITLLIFVRAKTVRIGALLILCYLLPVSQIFYELHNAAIYDRYLFIPVLGAGMLAGYGFVQLHARRPLAKPLLAVALLILTFLACLTLRYIPVYRSDVAVAKHAYALFPTWNASSYNLAVAFIEAGEFNEARMLLQKESALLQPKWVPEYLQGWIALEEGKLAIAAERLQKAFWLEVSGGYYPFAAIPLARVYLQNGYLNQAQMTVDTALRSRIANPVERYRAIQLQRAIMDMKAKESQTDD